MQIYVIHAKRVTLMPNDIQQAQRIQGGYGEVPSGLKNDV